MDNPLRGKSKRVLIQEFVPNGHGTQVLHVEFIHPRASRFCHCPNFEQLAFGSRADGVISQERWRKDSVLGPTSSDENTAGAGAYGVLSAFGHRARQTIFPASGSIPRAHRSVLRILGCGTGAQADGG